MPDDAAVLHRLPSAAGTDRPEPFRLLLGALDAAGVGWCHWKSNVRLARALAGGDDLDLLVRRSDGLAFAEAAARAGFKPARSGAGLDHPGVLHAFALDPARGRLVHLHAYAQVLSGDSLAKSWRLPVEAALLDGDARLHGVRVPEPSAELAAFVLRTLLKHRGAVETALARRDAAEAARELGWLEARADPARARALLAEWTPGLPDGFLDEARDAIADPAALAARRRLARRLVPHLRALRRLTPAAAALSRARRLVALGLARVRGRRDLRLASGGAIVALVGPKAVGKSTLGRALREALGEHLDVRQVHAGKPPPTALTALPRLLVPLARRARPGERSGAYEGRPERPPSLLRVLRLAMLAHERRALLLRCRRQASAGAIVLADRFPSRATGGLDGPAFDEAAVAACPSALGRWLMRREIALGRGLPAADVVLRLEADLGTALGRDATRRKPGGPDPDALRRRRAIESGGDYGPAALVPIDTARPIEATVREAVARVWERL